MKEAHVFAIFIGWEVPEQALGGIPLGFGIVVEDNFHAGIGRVTKAS